MVPRRWCTGCSEYISIIYTISIILFKNIRTVVGVQDVLAFDVAVEHILFVEVFEGLEPRQGILGQYI